MTYNYSATQNNGQTVSSVDAVTGESVSYTYDSLKRLIAAATAGTTGVQWGNTYSYDGFGNLTAKIATKGTAPSASFLVNSATNQVGVWGGDTFDADGNWMGTSAAPNTWNVENKLVSNGTVDGSGNLLTYTYDPWGKRVLQYSAAPGAAGSGTLYFYSITGQRLATYAISGYPYGLGTLLSQPMYFGKRLLAPRDRLGSVRQNGNGPIAYYPWGEERTTTPDNTDKFATYFRDVPGQDYARQRYYSGNTGSFWSPDPSMDNVDYYTPSTWNAYAYANGDPINLNDVSGLVACGDLMDMETGTSVSSIMTTYNDLGYLAQTIWHEAGPMYTSDVSNYNNFITEQAYIATALENRYDIANGTLTAYTASGGTVNPAAFGGPGTSLTSVVLQAAGNNTSWGIYSNGQLDNMSALQQVLSTDVSVGTQVKLPSGNSVNEQCFAVLSAVTEAVAAQGGARTEPGGVILTYWMYWRPGANGSSPDPGNTVTVAPLRPYGNTFYGYYTTQQPKPVRRPPHRPSKPGRPAE